MSEQGLLGCLKHLVYGPHVTDDLHSPTLGNIHLTHGAEKPTLVMPEDFQKTG